MDRAIEREHQAAMHEGQPWPPEPGHEEPDTAAPGRESPLEQHRPGIPGAQTEPEPGASKPGSRSPRLPNLSPLTTGAPPG
jgi:hypothetical protein